MFFSFPGAGDSPFDNQFVRDVERLRREERNTTTFSENAQTKACSSTIMISIVSNFKFNRIIIDITYELQVKSKNETLIRIYFQDNDCTFTTHSLTTS